MSEQPITRKTREERFTGHESFVCRYGWLRKLYDVITSTPKVFADEESAIITLGIGRNMVRSLRFWGEAFSLMEGSPNQGYQPTPFGHCLLDEETGVDPYLEDRDSLWLLHWKITVNANLAAWNVAFQDIQDHQFTKKRFSEFIYLRGRRINKDLVESTVRQHADIFFHTYASMNHHYDSQILEETLGCPLQELGIIRKSTTEIKDDVFLFDTGPKRGLTSKVFLYALFDYWEQFAPSNKTLSLKEVLYGKFSPGAVFKLSEYGVLDYLDTVDLSTDGLVQFVDSTDVRSLHMRGDTEPRSLKVRLGFDESRK